MHKIKCKQKCQCTGRPRAVFEQTPAKEVHKRNHPDSKQHTDNSPAKRIHAKHAHTKTDKYFTKRRMCPLIIAHSMRNFISRSRMINFIKISAAPKGNCLSVSILFIKQGISANMVTDFHRISIRIRQYQFIQTCIIRKCCQTDIAVRIIGKRISIGILLIFL